MDDVLNQHPELFVTVPGLLFFGALALALLAHIVRRMTLPKRVVVPQDWMPFEQRRFYNPGALPRAMAAILLAIVLVGGTVIGPFVLGLKEQLIFWYGGWGWPALVVVSTTLSLIAWYLLRPKRPRCPSCKSADLDKAVSLPKQHGSIRVYLCRPCRIVWQTKYWFGSHRGTTTHHGLNAPNANF